MPRNPIEFAKFLQGRVAVTHTDDCWEWLRYKNVRGYGKIMYAGKALLAPRVSYSLAIGEIPEGLHVLHRCDNSGCVNPFHLFAGTDQDNSDDKIAKGRDRKSKGDSHYARLHPERLARGDRHFSRLHPDHLARGERHHFSKLTDAKVVLILTRLAVGENQRDMASEFGVSQAVISAIARNITWRHVPR